MVIAVARVKDEADIIEATVRRMLAQVDHVIVADNGSTDGTRDILEALPVEVLDDPEVGYYQSRAMTRLAEQAAERGADWVVPFDADEVWLPRTDSSIKAQLGALHPAVLVAEAKLFDHVATRRDRRSGDPVRRLGWRRPAVAPLRKVAVRARPGLVIYQGNHSATFTGVEHPPTVTTALEVRHFPIRSPEQMIRKARNGGAAYAATDLPEEVGAHWRGWNRLSDERLRGVFAEFYWSADPESDGLVHDPV